MKYFVIQQRIKIFFLNVYLKTEKSHDSHEPEMMAKFVLFTTIER